MIIVHLTLVSLLFLTQCLFLYRSHLIMNKGISPSSLDLFLRKSSQRLIPLSILSGILLLMRTPDLTLKLGIHILTGFVPLVVLLSAAFLKPLKRRHPWVLPLMVFAGVTAAMLTGFFAGINQ